MGALPELPEATFSEPREWEECGECHVANYLSLHRNKEDALAPCPRCGQPPRCFAGQGTEDRHCPRPATTTHGIGLCCGQHYRAFELSCDLDEWEAAREHTGHLCALAKSFGNWALEEALDLAWAEVQMRVAVIEAEQRILWSW